MLLLAFRNLFQNKVRLAASIGGVALSLILVLSLDAIFTGVEAQITAYIRNAGADLFVSQTGVRNMHMASSWLPSAVVSEVDKITGVASATPLLFMTNMVVSGKTRNLAYIVGIPEEAKAGFPWRVTAGKAIPGDGETVIDSQVARKTGVGVGDRVSIVGRDFTVAGLSEGTASLVNSVAFISLKDFSRMRGDEGAVSLVLVKVGKGEPPAVVAERIAAELANVTVQLTSDFAEQERRTVKDMSTDVITVMNLAGFLIGMAVMALTVYTATLSRRREYGVLKAIGARNSDLRRAVLGQTMVSVGIGLLAALAFTELLSLAVPRVAIGFQMEMSLQSLVKVLVVSLAIGGLSAILPVAQIARLDPAMVFRGQGEG